MADLYTIESENRTDLLPVAEAVNPPEGYIGGKLLPTQKVTQPSGTVYYATVTADGTAATNRSAGSAPTGTRIAQSSTTFSAGEIIDRGLIAANQVEIMGGIANADKMGATFAVRSVMKKKEQNVCAAMLGVAASATFDAAKIQTQLQTAKQAIRRYSGKIALYGATETITRMVQQIIGETKTNPLFARLVTGGGPMEAAKGLSMEAYIEGLKMYLGVDEVLLGDDDIWGAGSYDGLFGVTKLPDALTDFSFMMKPELGRYFQYIPDGGQQYRIETLGDKDDKDNKYDAIINAQEKILNSGAIYNFSGVAA